ncbi:MAG: phosphatase PAP2 family protein, partial [Pseudonocardiaceae bacterium]
WVIGHWVIGHWVIGHWVIGHRVIGRRTVQVAVWTGALLMIVAVGVTRVYLGVHFPSDVLAGWALGAAWAVTIALVMNVWEQSRGDPDRLDSPKNERLKND